jgi:ComF family protein
VTTFASVFEDVLHIFYPHLCVGCGDDLLENNQLLCANCMNDLPHTFFATIPNNSTEQLFSGRINVAAAHSEFYFSKGQLVQHLIHLLKYKGNLDLGFLLGKIMGEQLLKSNRFNSIDFIIPLPMLHEKRIKRGYNQATIIAEGASSVMGITILDNIIIRNRKTETQTNKQRAERWDNVDGSFEIIDIERIKGKNILLVDDVITTGATIEACGQAILNVTGTKLFISTLAKASN